MQWQLRNVDDETVLTTELTTAKANCPTLSRVRETFANAKVGRLNTLPSTALHLLQSSGVPVSATLFKPARS